jgi:hypothetical protein
MTGALMGDVMAAKFFLRPTAIAFIQRLDHFLARHQAFAIAAPVFILVAKRVNTPLYDPLAHATQFVITSTVRRVIDASIMLTGSRASPEPCGCAYSGQ